LSHLSRIGLGTAQFGTNYGISNRNGQPSESEVAAILARAVKTGIGYLDTAASYADAEKLIGRYLPSGHGLRIITKLPAIAEDVITSQHVDTALTALAASLESLAATRVYGVMLHRADDLAKPGWQHLIEALREAQVRGWSSRVGVSVYDASDLDLVTSRFAPEIVQLPFNALDHRLAASGWLARLRACGVEVHARSLFLQGLLLMPPTTLPAFFAPISGALAGLHARWAGESLSPLAGCLGAAIRNGDIDVAVVGVNRLHELTEIESALVYSEAAGDVLPPPIDPVYLDPRRWPKTPQ
jgi:aryl-alcohol dehydrogenase-like predicted oxidoreductase